VRLCALKSVHPHVPLMKTATLQLPWNPQQQGDELAATKAELQATKKALKVQAARCRHLVVAFSKKLEEKDAQAKACRDLRDKQLSSLLRALLVLEARLKKEQKSIRNMLAEKDNVINDQQLEIKRLQCEMENARSFYSERIEETSLFVKAPSPDGSASNSSSDNVKIPRDVQPDLISSLGIRDVEKKCSPLEVSPSPSVCTVYDNSSPECYPPSMLSSSSTKVHADSKDDSDGYLNCSATLTPKGAFSIHNHSAFSPIIKKQPESVGKVTPSTPESEENFADSDSERHMSEKTPDKYQDNPVLQCVNQILLKDQEDFLEEQRSLRTRVGSLDGQKSAWMAEDEDDLVIEEENEEPLNTSITSVPTKKSPKPESEFTLNVKKSHSMTELSRSPKPHLSCFKGSSPNKKPQNIQFHNPPMTLFPPQPVRMDTSQLGLQPLLPLSILELDEGSQDSELYVISNSALDDDIVKQLQGRSLNMSALERKTNRPASDHRGQHTNLPNGLLHPEHKQQERSLSNDVNLISAASTLFSNLNYPSDEHKSPKKSQNDDSSNYSYSSPCRGHQNAIKVASPVATLLTSSGNIEDKNDVESSTLVSQMVKRFEGLGTQENGSGNNKEPEGESSIVSYDNFLEATGLSQKSIMTPSRMLSNHKSVLKPKDVKHRSRAKAAAIITERNIPSQVVGPTVKYWTEPFL